MLNQYKAKLYYYIMLETTDSMDSISYYGKPQTNGQVTFIKNPKNLEELEQKAFTNKKEANLYKEELYEEYLSFMDELSFYLSVHSVFL